MCVTFRAAVDPTFSRLVTQIDPRALLIVTSTSISEKITLSTTASSSSPYLETIRDRLHDALVPFSVADNAPSSALARLLPSVPVIHLAVPVQALVPEVTQAGESLHSLLCVFAPDPIDDALSSLAQGRRHRYTRRSADSGQRASFDVFLSFTRLSSHSEARSSTPLRTTPDLIEIASSAATPRCVTSSPFFGARPLPSDAHAQSTLLFASAAANDLEGDALRHSGKDLLIRFGSVEEHGPEVM